MKVLVATLMSMCLAKENFSLEMHMSASIRPYPLALNASPVRPELVLGFLSTGFHSTIVRDANQVREHDQVKTGVLLAGTHPEKPITGKLSSLAVFLAPLRIPALVCAHEC